MGVEPSLPHGQTCLTLSREPSPFGKTLGCLPMPLHRCKCWYFACVQVHFRLTHLMWWPWIQNTA